MPCCTHLIEFRLFVMCSRHQCNLIELCSTHLGEPIYPEQGTTVDQFRELVCNQFFLPASLSLLFSPFLPCFFVSLILSGGQACLVYCHCLWISLFPPKGARGCFILPLCLESQGCHSIPLSYMCVCVYIYIYIVFLPIPLTHSVLSFVPLMVHSPDFFLESSQTLFVKELGFLVWLLLSG